MVTFSHPIDWVVTYPSNDVNGEDGTIQAGEYAKGDTATLFVYNEPGHVEVRIMAKLVKLLICVHANPCSPPLQNIDKQDKAFFENAIIKAISQKGNNVYQDFKVTKVEPTSGGFRDQKYVLCDFKYVLLTGAGFEVDRRGVASITSEGDAVEVLWCATIRQRYVSVRRLHGMESILFRSATHLLSFPFSQIQEFGTHFERHCWKLPLLC